MAGLEFYSGGKLLKFRGTTLSELQRQRAATRPMAPVRTAAADAVNEIEVSLRAQTHRLTNRFHAIQESIVRVMPTASEPSRGLICGMIPTETIAVEGASKSELKWLRQTYGVEQVDEGSHDKVLLQAPEGDTAGLKIAFDAAKALYERGKVAAAHPNFLRVIRRPKPSAAGAAPWHLNNPGNPGRFGADVHALAAWTITKGDPDIRVAVLDEGVDTKHARLKSQVVAELDVVDDNPHARPDGDDAHGTACAGIVVSQDQAHPGLAPKCSLVAVRIAKDDGNGFWVFDDFATADAIDWSWDDAKADVLSNSWGGGPPVDVMTRAFERARTDGRDGKGAVVVVAAGNDQAPIDYPGVLPNVLTVGASNQWDERKTHNSKDGEDWWGSNHGSSLDLLAPGVEIATTDISGSKGYSSTMFTKTFNGTSSATPLVAACAGLILSLRPDLSEQVVRNIITESADHLTRSGARNNTLGHGRLNCYAALRLARQHV